MFNCQFILFFFILGYNPVWKDELEFKVHVPELALISFIAMESSNTFLGQYTLPLRCMQQGNVIIIYYIALHYKYIFLSKMKYLYFKFPFKKENKPLSH